MLSNLISTLIVSLLLARIDAKGLASTTHYFDGNKGACGCGNDHGMFPWQTGFTVASETVYTAAGSQALFDQVGGSWCGAGCGKCFRLTATGKANEGQGLGAKAGTCITVMITNLCPNAGNAQWCPQPGDKNQYGFDAHFDLMLQTGEINGEVWDNPIVEYEEIECPGIAKDNHATCECASNGTEPKKEGTETYTEKSKTTVPAPAVTTNPPVSQVPSYLGGGSGETEDEYEEVCVCSVASKE